MKQLPDVEAFVSTYLNQLGLHDKKDADEYLDYLYQRHESPVIDRFLDILEERNEGGGETLFDFKNQTVALSLDIAHYTADLYQQYLNWFCAANTHLAPKRILDIGCENGIVTCFYAMLFPTAMVYGVDISENSITCAKALASKLSLQNVRFDCLDVMELHRFDKGNHFDMVTSLCVVQEATGYFSNEQSEQDMANSPLSKLSLLLTSIHDLLNNEDSRFICCERFLDSKQISNFAYMLRTSGLSIHWLESRNIQFHELDEEERMPVFVITKESNEIK